MSDSAMIGHAGRSQAEAPHGYIMGLPRKIGERAAMGFGSVEILRVAARRGGRRVASTELVE